MIFSQILLNIGLFFILFYFTPIIAGLVGGYFLASRNKGIQVSFISSLVTYTLIFAITEVMTGQYLDIVTLLFAALMMSGLSMIGGFIGGVIGERSFHQSRQVVIN
ncbi:MAG: hypothetical protein GF411_12035 [Candidatus Lokiarchaeota archaeon]|nr:hypothetical protein [Candidatus Lokiarchaeota archaeon]